MLQTELSVKEKESIVLSLESLRQITQKIGHEDLQKHVDDLINRINDPFMFVIVGEVKAGKSSFINALLGTDKEICKVAPSPMTDTIQQIVYGPEQTETTLGEHLKRITFPVEILKDVAIVDTPGTNTIIEYHQEITEEFIPVSDLIIFVFESKNPYRESAWKFFDYINDEWRKKIIFVLQQKDLMEPEDLVINTKGVEEYALKKGMTNVPVFAVSAKMELEGNKSESGFQAVHEYVNKTITGGKAPYQKLLSNLGTAETINDRIKQGLFDRKRQYEIDLKFRTEIQELLDSQEEKTKNHINILVENLISKYDKITSSKYRELQEGFSFVTMIKRSFRSLFGDKQNVKEWLDGLFLSMETELNTSLRDKLQHGVIDIAEDIQDMAKLVDAKIKTSETVLKDNHEIFANIAERRANILRDLQRTFTDFMSRTENFYAEGMQHEGKKLLPNIAKGSGAAIIGIMLAAVTNTAVLDITGGIMTAIGLVFTGITVGGKKRKILQQFEEEVNKGRVQIEEEVFEKLSDYTANIKFKIDQNFHDFDTLLKEEKNTIEWIDTEQTTLTQNIITIKEKVSKQLERLK